MASSPLAGSRSNTKPTQHALRPVRGGGRKVTIFIRKPALRDSAETEEHALPRVTGRILTGVDLARTVPPSEVAEVVADEVRNPAIREGDVLVPLSVGA